MSEEEEYELVPLSPIRRLEKRLERIEKGKSSNVDSSKFFSEIVEIIRMNQQIVDELAKANDALRIEISRLPGKMDELIGNIDELVSYIKAAAGTGESASGESMDPLLKKMDKLIEGNKKIVESNESVISTVEQLSGKLKRPPYPSRLKRKRLSGFNKKIK